MDSLQHPTPRVAYCRRRLLRKCWEYVIFSWLRGQTAASETKRHQVLRHRSHSFQEALDSGPPPCWCDTSASGVRNQMAFFDEWICVIAWCSRQAIVQKNKAIYIASGMNIGVIPCFLAKHKRLTKNFPTFSSSPGIYITSICFVILLQLKFTCFLLIIKIWSSQLGIIVLYWFHRSNTK